MAFRLNKTEAKTADTPESLFADLRTKKVDGLLAPQADVLRSYYAQAVDESDVAIPMHTGGGKTLVGLLIAEWRRRKFKERVVFLCPTKQLVHQVADQANNKYGLRALPFVDSKKTYAPASSAAYISGEAIAVTTYSSLFNVKPFFSDANTLILDDAHAAEQYVSSVWTLAINRWRSEEYAATFDAVMACLQKALTDETVRRATSSRRTTWDRSWVDLVPAPKLAPLIPELSEILDAECEKTELKYPWSRLTGHLHACQIYISVGEILIRPLIPPTFDHGPFASARQRVYLSATLGEAGDLERSVGRRRIVRLPEPAGWDTRGLGRRLFIIPNSSLGSDDVSEVTRMLAKKAGRALVLVPDDETAGAYRKLFEGVRTFSAKEIEESKRDFVSEPEAVAVMASRYDGIDFPGKECRLIILHGLPTGMSLQERFIVSTIGAARALDERLLTRLVQGFGRCTRSDTDFAAVVICGGDLSAYLHKAERRHSLHPELQAELEFGLGQSKEQTKEGFVENLDIFLRQGDEWRPADEYIVTERDKISRQPLPGGADLKGSVPDEVSFVENLWNQNFGDAASYAQKVLGKLNDSSLRGYRALWEYLAGAACFWGTEAQQFSASARAKEHFMRARSAAPSLIWLSQLVGASEAQSTDESNPLTLAVVQRLGSELAELGIMNDRRFAARENEIRRLLQSNNSGDFEQGHELLGKMLGYEAGKIESTGSPDPWWLADRNFCIVFEDHSAAQASSSLNVTKARQATTHDKWIRANLSLNDDAKIVKVLVTPVTTIDADAVPFVTDVLCWNLDDFRQWANAALDRVRQLRVTFSEPGDLEWIANAASIFATNQIAPDYLIAMLAARPASKVLRPTGKK